MSKLTFNYNEPGFYDFSKFEKEESIYLSDWTYEPLKEFGIKPYGSHLIDKKTILEMQPTQSPSTTERSYFKVKLSEF